MIALKSNVPMSRQPRNAPRPCPSVRSPSLQVLVYLIRLADRCNVDLAAAAVRKLQKCAAVRRQPDSLHVQLRLIITTADKPRRPALRRNREKYPADKCRGRSDKYTAYAATPSASAAAAGAAGGREEGAGATESGSAGKGAPAAGS